MSPDVIRFLSQSRDVAGSEGPDINARLDNKRKEREEHKKDAQRIAKDLKKLRNQKARTANKNEGSLHR